MEYHIELIISLQKLDLCILERNKFIEQFAELQAELDRQVETAQESLASKQAELDEAKKAQRRAESNLQAGEDKLVQAQAKLSISKTNREYEAGLKEIEKQNQRNSDLEGEVLKLMDRIEQLEQESKQCVTQEAQTRTEIEQRKKELKQTCDRAEKQVAQAGSERDKITPDLPEDILDRYQKLRKHLGDPVVVPAKDEICSACHVRMPAQFYNEVLKGQKLINCNMCQRFLIVRENDLRDEIEPLV